MTTEQIKENNKLLHDFIGTYSKKKGVFWNMYNDLNEKIGDYSAISEVKLWDSFLDSSDFSTLSWHWLLFLYRRIINKVSAGFGKINTDPDGDLLITRLESCLKNQFGTQMDLFKKIQDFVKWYNNYNKKEDDKLTPNN